MLVAQCYLFTWTCPSPKLHLLLLLLLSVAELFSFFAASRAGARATPPRSPPASPREEPAEAPVSARDAFFASPKDASPKNEKSRRR